MFFAVQTVACVNFRVFLIPYVFIIQYEIKPLRCF